MAQKVLVIIPAYNEEKTITNILLGLRQTVPEFDRIVINDGSQDGTGRVVAELGERQLGLPCNLGYGRALQTGLKYALIRGYDIVVSIDADGQHRVEDVSQLVHELNESGADMVIGSRFCKERAYNTVFSRKMGQLLFSYLTHFLLGRRIYDTSSGFKAIRASACQVVVDGSFMDFHLESIVLLSLLNYKIMEYPIEVKERVTGHSMHSFASVFQYPFMTILLTLVAIMDAMIIRRRK